MARSKSRSRSRKGASKSPGRRPRSPKKSPQRSPPKRSPSKRRSTSRGRPPKSASSSPSRTRSTAPTPKTQNSRPTATPVQVVLKPVDSESIRRRVLSRPVEAAPPKVTRSNSRKPEPSWLSSLTSRVTAPFQRLHKPNQRELVVSLVLVSLVAFLVYALLHADHARVRKQLQAFADRVQAAVQRK